MVTLANLDGASLVPDLRQGFAFGTQEFGRRQEREALREEERQAAEGQQQALSDAFQAVQSPVQEARQQGLLTIARIQGPKAAQAVTALLDRGSEQQVEAARVEAEKDLQYNTALESSLKGVTDPGRRARIIGETALQFDLRGEDLAEATKLQNTPVDEQDLRISREIVSVTPGKQLLEQRAEELKFQREQASRPQFESVFNDNGEIVAQRNTATGEVKKSPLASGVRGGPNEKGTFTKGVSLLARNPDGSTSVLTPVTDSRTGETTLQRADVGGEIVSRTFGETGIQETTRKIGQAGATEGTVLEARAKGIGAVEKAKVTNKGRAQRTQQRITKGIEASSSLPIINRGIELLDSVKTGGFAAAQLRAKQAFGIESADEAELSSNLGKAVLSQLRSTFGAAFTENEGNRLARIEAGFGKSVAGNRRLLQQARKIALDAANRGLRQARAQGDTESVQEIQDLIDFRLTPEETDVSKMTNEEFLKTLK